MKFRFVSAALFALAMPLAAQAPAAAETEGLFYKAFYLEKGQRDFVGAMALYEEFLAKAPESKLASEAAKQNFKLLGSTGKTKERDAFKAKYAKLLGDMADAPAAADRPARAGADAAGGDRQGRGQGGAGFGGRMDPAARMAELEKALATAKESGDAEAIKKAEADIERAKQMAQRGAGGRGRGGLFGAMANNKKYSEMTDEEKTALKDGVGQASTMIDRMRQNGQDDAADKLETSVTALKKALDAGKAEDVQKALDALRESMPQRGRRGGGGGGGQPGGAGGNNGGGGGNGGGGNNGGGGGGGGNNGGGGGGGF